MKTARFYIRLFVALSLMGWWQFVLAANYQWSWSAGFPPYFSSPSSACSAYIAARPASEEASLTGVRKHSETQWVCEYKYKHANGSYLNTTKSVYRGGSTCDPLETYDPATGECKPPGPNECESLQGQASTWSMLRPDLNGLGSIEYACMAGCRLALGTSQCAPVSEGATTGVCWGIGTFNGAQCQPGDNPTGGTPPPDPTDPPEPTDPPPECGPGFSWSGTTCVKDEPPKCDPSTGEVCPPPDEKCDPATETCPPGEGDGDGDGEGEGGDGDGDGSGDGDGDGEGEGDGDGEGTGEGDGDGEETGECDPKTDPNQCKKSSVAGEACDAQLKCEGDVIQCAILRKNKEQLCQWKYDGQVKTQIETELAGPDYQLSEETTPMGSLFNNAVNKGRWLPSACPSPENVTVMGRSYTISWEPVCRFAKAIAPLVVALASLFFATFIGRALKGS